MEKAIAEIISRMEKINSDQDEIERQAKLENDNGLLNDEQRSAYESLDSMFDSLLKQKKQIESDMQRIYARANRADDLAPRVFARRTQPNSGAPANPQARVTGQPIEVENAETGEMQIRFKIPRDTIRIGTPENFHGVKNGLDAEHRAYRFGQWVLATVSRAMPGYYNFESAKEFVRNYMNPTNTAHSESDGVTGGHYLVPDEFNRDLIDLREQFGVVRRLFGRAAMTGDTLNTPRRASGLTAAFIGENAAGTESNMTWNNVALVAKKLMAISRMSNELNSDAAISIGDALAGEMAYAFSEKEDQCGFNGDGTSTYGGMLGVRTLLTSFDGTSGTDSIGLKIQGTSNTWATQVLADFHAVVGKLPVYADTQNATWVCHKTYWSEVMQKLEIAAGGTTSLEVAAGDRRPRPMFLGYPVTFSQVFPSQTATSGVTCALGDFTKGALFGDRQQTTIAFSEHATIGGENVFERNQIAVRGTERFDLNVHGCGTASVYGPIVGLATS